ncbi:MAG: DinB family protein [Segetibacter sp.]|nr:DinB family protein [Segetibacter sp.]
MANLVPGSYPAYAAGYINLVSADSVTEAIEKYSSILLTFFKNIPEDKIAYRYAEGKWNLKEMLQHIIDAERIFAYRALRIARHDKTPLAGFDEGTYANASNADARSWESLLTEFEVVRKSTDLLLQSFTEDQLAQTGITNEQPNTVIALCFTIFGHILHHINIVKERYL